MDKKGLFGGTRGEEKRPGHAADRVAAMSTAELAETVEKLEKDMNELRGQYELYFMGVERLEPLIGRDSIRSQLRRFKELQINNTGLKFKIQMLQARMISLETYWGRVNRQREAGTYKRDVDKVKRREAELAAQAAKKEKEAAVAQGRAPKSDLAATAAVARAGDEGQMLAGQALREGAQEATTSPRVQGPAPRPSTVGRPTASRAEDLSDPALRQLYQTYVTAKRRCGEQVDLRYEEMAASLKKQIPKLMKSTGAKAIEFKVVIKSGTAVLKAVPKT